MLDRVVAGLGALRRRVRTVERRLRRFERREASALRRWFENTENLVHVSILVFVPVLIAAVTYISNRLDLLPYLLFPPLASGAHSLFAKPEGQYASPRRFVGGLTAGALCGWAALEVGSRFWNGAIGGAFTVEPWAAALGVLLTGAATWALDLEEPSAFSTALLVHVVGADQFVYVLSVLASTSLVAVVFLIWRDRFYERRGQLLYETTTADDNVLVPMRGDDLDALAAFGARLAAAHEGGKVVLLDVLEDGTVEDPDDLPGQSGTPADPPDAVSERVSTLEARADRVRTRVGVPCEVVVAAGDPGPTTVDVAREAGCDLVVVPFEEDRGALSSFVGTVFRSPIDAVALRTAGDRDRWRRVLVAVARPGDSAHAMVDFAARLAGRTGEVSVCTCIDREGDRRAAENRLARIVETFDAPLETRVATEEVTEFLSRNAPAYDLVLIGSSGDRSAASRFVSPPTFERLRDLDSDLGVVDRGDPP